MKKQFLEGMGVVIFILAVMAFVGNWHWAHYVIVGVFFTAMNGIVSFFSSSDD